MENYKRTSRWPESRTLAFVRGYRRHECLWNQNHPEYKDTSAREKALYDLTKISEIPGFTTREARYKIKNLRSTFMQEYRKVQASKKLKARKKGSIRMPTLCWYEDMRVAMQMQECEDKPEEIHYPDHKTGVEDHMLYPPAQQHGAEDYMSYPPIQQVDTEGDWQMKTEEENISEFSIEYNDAGTWEPIQEVDKADIEVSVPGAVSTDKSPPREVLCQNEDKNCSCCCSRLRDEQVDEFYHFGQNVACQLRKLPLKTSLRAQLVISRLLAKERLTKRIPRRRFRSRLRRSKGDEEEEATSSAAAFTATHTPERHDDDDLTVSQFSILEH